MINENKMVRYDNLCRKQPLSGISNVEGLQQAIKDLADRHNIPMDFYVDEVSSGGMPTKRKNPCVCIFNPDHKNTWLKYCVKISYDGDYAVYEVYHLGHSKMDTMENMMDKSRRNQARRQADADVEFRGDVVWRTAQKANNAILGGAARGVMGLVKGSDKKNQGEKNWYSDVQNIIKMAFGETI